MENSGQLARATYDVNHDKYTALLARDISTESTVSEKKLHTQAKEVLKQIETLVEAEEPMDAKDFADLNEVLVCCTRAIEKPKDKENIEAIAKLSEAFSGKTSSLHWNTLGSGLLVFVGCILLAVGILAAIPTGGLSLGGAFSGAALIGVGVAEIGPDALGEIGDVSGDETLDKGLEGLEGLKNDTKSKRLGSEMKLFKHELEDELEEIEHKAEDDEGEGGEHPSF
jgi:hypothetical protein